MDLSSITNYNEDGRTDVLLDRVQGGDSTAYEELVTRVAPRLSFYIQARLSAGLKAKVEVQDILQETLMQAHNNLDQFQSQGEGAFCRWLYSIAENRIRSTAERFNAKKRKPEGVVLRNAEAWEGLSVMARGPATEAAFTDERQRLVEAMEGLPDDQREVLVYKFFHEMSLHQIATQLGKPKSTVQTLVTRATLNLGRQLKKNS